MMKKLEKYLNPDIYYPVFLLGIVLVFNLMLVQNFFPVTEGWFQDWSRYMADGKMPYKDFYLYIPPVYVYITHFVNIIFDNSYLALRVFGIVERLLLIYVVYRIVRRLYKPWTCFVAIVASAAFYMSTNSDVFYGYYQNALLWGALALLFSIKCFEVTEKRKIKLSAIMAGAFCGLACMSKQTAVFFIAILAFGVLVAAIKNGGIKSACRLGLYGVAGVMLIVIPICIYLALNGAFLPFLECMTAGSSSKGDLSSIFFGFIPRMINDESIVLFILALILFVIVCLESAISSKGKSAICSVLRRLAVADYSLIVGLLSYWILLAIGQRDSSASPSKGTLAVFVLMVVIHLVVWLLGKKIGGTTEKIVKPFAFVSLCMIFIFMITTNQVSYFSWSLIREKRQLIIYALFFFMILWTIFISLRMIVKGDKVTPSFLISVFSLGFMYTHGMSYIVEDHAMLIPLAYILGMIMDVLAPKYEKAGSYIRVSVVLFAVFTFISVFYQRVWWPYNWWGVNSMGNRYEAVYSYEDPQLAGLKGTWSECEAVNAIYSDLSEYKDDYRNPTMFSFPHINYFNTIFDMDSPTYAKVHYFDVCTDGIAKSDAKILEEEKPSFILWMDFDEGMWETHEAIFRGGQPSGQRALQAVVEDMVSNGVYEEVGTYNIGQHSSPITLYRYVG